MIVAIEQISFIGCNSYIPGIFPFSNQAGKGRVFYSADKCFKTEADPRNIFDKQSLKLWTPCLSAFYCMIPRATLALSLKNPRHRQILEISLSAVKKV